jgi:hypothetical protein
VRVAAAGEASRRPSAKPRSVGCVGGGLRGTVNLVPCASSPPPLYMRWRQEPTNHEEVGRPRSRRMSKGRIESLDSVLEINLTAAALEFYISHQRAKQHVQAPPAPPAFL